MADVKQAAATADKDLPQPWVRQWDDRYNCFFYINPETNPPTTQWVSAARAATRGVSIPISCHPAHTAEPPR